jgi:hypothetical protein
MKEDLHLAPSPTTPPTTQPTNRQTTEPTTQLTKKQRRRRKRNGEVRQRRKVLTSKQYKKQMRRLRGYLPPLRLSYRTRFIVQLPSFLTNTKCKSTHALLIWLLNHFWQCDKTATLEPFVHHPRVNYCRQEGRGHPEYGLSPPLGPDTVLESREEVPLIYSALPQYWLDTLPYIGSYCRDKKQRLKPCSIVISHSIHPILLLDLLNESKEQQQQYRFDPPRNSDFAKHLVRTRACVWTRACLQANFLDKPHSAKARAAEHIRKTSGDPLPPSLLGAGYRLPPPITGQDNILPLAVELIPYDQSLSNPHSATTKVSLGLRWLLAVLERQRTTSWDWVALCRLW